MASITDLHIQQLGHWKSSAYQGYIKTPTSVLKQLSQQLVSIPRDFMKKFSPTSKNLKHTIKLYNTTIIQECIHANDIFIYSTAQMQRRSRSHHFASGEYTRVMFNAQVTLCYSRALEMTNSQVIFPQDNRSSRSRRAKL